MRRRGTTRTARAAVAASVAAAACLSCASEPGGRDRLIDAVAAIDRLSSVAYRYTYQGTGSAAGSYTGRARIIRPAGDPPVYWAELRPSPSWTPTSLSGPSAGEQSDAEPPALILSGGGDFVGALDEALPRFSHGTISGGSGHLVANAPFAVLAAFTDARPFEAELASDLELVGRETVGGVPCDVLRGRSTAFGGARVWWHIGVADDLPRAFRWEADDGSGSLAFEIRSLVVNAGLTAEQLAISVDLLDPESAEVIDEDARRVEPGVPAPAWTLETDDGAPLRLADLRGDIAILNFWATWCASCRDLAGAYTALSGQWRGEGVRFVHLNAWEAPEAKPRNTAREWGLDAPVLVRAERIASDYKLATVPAVFVVDAEGTLALVRNPALADPEAQARELEQVVRSLRDGDR